MVAKRARREKPILSRQDIAHRRRAISEKKLRTTGAAYRALWAVFVSAASALSLLALVTFNVRDRVGPGFRNAVGPVGHALADVLRGLFGLCAYVVPAALAYTAAVLLRGERGRRRWPQVASLALFLACAAVFVDLGWPWQKGMAHPSGGAVGHALSGLLRGMFSTVGTIILVTSAGVAALIMGTQFAFLKACSVGWGVLRGAAGHIMRWGSTLWAAQKRAVERQRAVMAQRKLEDAAFLAQLEADEDELAAAEREAQEAEAAAEEAQRLADEAAQRKAAPKLKVVPSVVAPPVPSALPAVQVQDDPGKRRGRAAPSAIPGGTRSAEAEEVDAEFEPVSVPVGPSAMAAAARMPLIVEPKVPPKPTATPKKQAESFEFIGDRKAFTLPPLDVLHCDKAERSALDKEAFLSTAERLRAKLADFGIVGEVVEIRPGPVVTMYEFLPGPGIKVSKIASLADDLAMAMEAMRVRIVAPIPGKGVVGIEVPNRDRETVYLKEIAEQDLFIKSSSKLTMCVGKDIEGMPYVLDLAKAPHLLIAGTTGSGKSVAVNSMIMSILLKSTPEEVRFIMVDPKMLELSVYEGIPHLLLPVVTDPKKAALALRWTVEEMERRYHLLSEVGVRNIAGYNKLVESVQGEAKALVKAKEVEAEAVAPKKVMVIEVEAGEAEDDALERSRRGAELGVAAPREDAEDVREPLASLAPEALNEAGEALPTVAAGSEEKSDGEKKELKKLPYIVLIIDELADLMMVASREVETYIARLAQMARASGIHLMVATQRPSTDVVTGIIKANFPTRVSFMLRSKPDSMTILGTVGAESLLGMGDMLIMPPTSSHLQRVHGAFVSDEEIKRAVNHLKAQGKPVFDESILKPREGDSEEGGGGAEDELSDELYDQALAIVSEMRAVSISMLQRKMRIGYNRAARMIERMERDGVVGPADGAKPREVLLRPVGEMPGAGA
ncbi:MAG TPA: DNA translocase FtsK 4TM domain-containing protein [Myxococcaceae bacterium]|nr:DNA translocase FtsK 4TM domain-containing protein [Myxococcaceae bacterium]